MSSAPDRQKAISLIDDAVRAGAGLQAACAALGLCMRTLQRWRLHQQDGRPGAHRAAPPNQLSQEQRQAVLEAANRPEFASLTPHQIVPRLADEGIYLASESTIYRLLRAAGQQHARGRAKPATRRPITTHSASGPNQLWCWDITWMPTAVKGQYFYWYMVKDIYSRKLVANEVCEVECSEHAAQLLQKACLRERTAGKPLVLHSDNGSAMKGATMRTMMDILGVSSSFSRPRVSNDNAYAEALFRTAKYCPKWPEKPFETLEQARQWVMEFVRWYNLEHRHSGLKYVTPQQRHDGQASALLRKRSVVYERARKRYPLRWSGRPRDWTLEDVVYLNPERESAREVKFA